MIRPFGKMTLLALAFCGYTSLAGCGNRGAGNAQGTEQTDTTGAIDFGLQVSSGVNLATVNYTITGPNAFTKTGAINVSTSTKLTTTIGGLPAGVGYVITLTSTATDGSTTCAGSGTFDIT
ncbi:MAG TPA: hypothetical protein VGP07_15715, partial [Polyangia bacterium]